MKTESKCSIKDILTSIQCFFDLCGYSVMVTNPQGQILYINKSCIKALEQSSADAILNKNIDEIIITKTGINADENEIEFLKSNGSLYLAAVKSNEIRSPNGEMIGIFYLIRDFSLQKKLEKFMNIQNNSLYQAAKLNALSEMAGSISHEINNPLAIIMGKAERLLKGLSDQKFSTDTIKHDLEKIKNNSVRISKVIDGLRQFSRSGEKDRFELVPVSKIVSDTISLCHERFKIYGIEIRQKNIADLKIECQPMQLVHVLLNLLNNSFDAIKTHDDKWIEIELASHADNKAVIMVTDSGAGISKNIVDNIMEPFFTTKEVGEGMGLGLSSSQGIIHDHGGKLYIDKSYSNTRFIIELPILRE